MTESTTNTVFEELVALLEQNKLTELGSLLTSSGVDVNTKIEGGLSLLTIAIIVNDKAIETLHQHGAVISNDSNEFISPVLLASLIGKTPVVEKLLTLYPEQQQYIENEHGILQTALRNYNRELVNKLYKFIDNAQEKYQYTALHQAVETHDQAQLKVLLEGEAKALLNQKDFFGYTALHLAVMNQEPLMLELLLNSGADKHILLPNNLTALDMAIQKANPSLISLLMNTPLVNSEHDDVSDQRPVISTQTLREMLSNSENKSALNLKELLEKNGYSPLLKECNVSKLKAEFSYVDLNEMSFKDCQFYGRNINTNLKAHFDNCTFQKFEGDFFSFLPGTTIKNSIFEDAIFKNAHFDNVKFDNNNFFYTAFKNTSFDNVAFSHNNFYGAQLWNVTLDNSTAVDVNFVQSSFNQVNGQTMGEIATHTAPVIGIFGEITQLSILTKPGFMAAEPYMRIKQAGASPHLISQYEIFAKLSVSDLDNEVATQLQDLSTKPSNESIVQHVLHAPTPAIEQLNSLAKSYAEKLDALWIPGGPDIHPAFYGKEIPQGESFSFYDDMFEFALLDQMLAQGKPVLGVCHGAQLINVYYGGTLLQDVPGHNGVVQPVNFINHEGPLASAVKGDTVWGLSAHHQAMDIVAEPLTKVAEYNGITKAAQGKTEPVFLVQFHPEYLLDDNNANILNSFFDKTKENLALRNADLKSAQTINLCDVISNVHPLFADDLPTKQCVLNNAPRETAICFNQHCDLSHILEQAQVIAA